MAIATNLRSEDALLSFLPLIYVVWSDGSVSPDEVRSLAARVEQADLEPGDRNLLADLIDHLRRPERLAEAGEPLPSDLPHTAMIEAIDRVLPDGPSGQTTTWQIRVDEADIAVDPKLRDWLASNAPSAPSPARNP